MGRISKAVVLAIVKENSTRIVADTAAVLMSDYVEKTLIEIAKTSDRIATLNKRRTITPSDVLIAIEQLEQRRGKI